MTAEQFITKLEQLQEEAVQACLYLEAATLQDAKARIKNHYEESLCKPCTPPPSRWHYGLRSFIQCYRPVDVG